MATIIKEVHPKMYSKYQLFEGTTDFTAGDTIDVLASLGRGAKRVMIITESSDTIEFRFNTMFKSYPVRDMQTSIDNAENPDIANGKELTTTLQGVIRIEPSNVITFDLAVCDIQITENTGTPQILVM